MSDLTTIGALIGVAVGVVGVLLVGARAIAQWRRPAGPGQAPVEHTGWEDGHLGELAALRGQPTEQLPAADADPGPASAGHRARHAAEYVPRHDVDTIGWRIRPAGWTPPIGAQRIASVLDTTQVGIPPATDTEVGR